MAYTRYSIYAVARKKIVHSLANVNSKILLGMVGGIPAVVIFQVSSTSAEQLPSCEKSKFG